MLSIYIAFKSNDDDALKYTLSIRLRWKVIIDIGLDLSTFATVITPFDQYVLLQSKNDTTILCTTSWWHRVRKLHSYSKNGTVSTVF